ncbi:MAG: arginine--tRNA ligase [Pirellulales bacterium]
MNILANLRNRFVEALAPLADDAATLAQMVLPSQDAKFGDYQANCAMPLAKKLGKPPREVAAEIVSRLELGAMCHPPEIAGPGFINLRLRDDWLVEQLEIASRDGERLGVERCAHPRTIAIDYSSPNVAKPMHVGHIRSTVIGAALDRTLRFLGHQVVSDNHIGDWGTQFGMIIYGYKHFVDKAALEREPVAELSRLYKQVNGLVEYHELRTTTIPATQDRIAELRKKVAELNAAPPTGDKKQDSQRAKQARSVEAKIEEAAAELAGYQAKVAAVDADPILGGLAREHTDIGRQVLAETAKLHAGDATNRELWERFLPPCLAEIEKTYQRLGVTFDHSLGESFYHDRLPHVVESLQEKGIARESDGAICVFLEGYEAPFIVRKQDGAFLYSTTDLATIEYRVNEWRHDTIVYVVDHRQSLHFEQLFATAKRWGFDRVELVHVSFGTVLGEDGKPFKTRAGVAVGLMDLLDEAVERAYRIVSENDDKRPEPQLSVGERQQVAERIGIGAIKYADLAHNRTSDYVFSYDKMLAMTGNTAAYMQYSYARVRSIFAKADAAASDFANAKLLLTTPAERALALAILQLAEALDRVVGDYRPNHLTAYLFDVASRYSEFFENCPVLRAETTEVRASRFKLCDLTARTLKLGLGLLGIEVVERM